MLQGYRFNKLNVTLLGELFIATHFISPVYDCTWFVHTGTSSQYFQPLIKYHYNPLLCHTDEF